MRPGTQEEVRPVPSNVVEIRGGPLLEPPYLAPSTEQRYRRSCEPNDGRSLANDGDAGGETFSASGGWFAEASRCPPSPEIPQEAAHKVADGRRLARYGRLLDCCLGTRGSRTAGHHLAGGIRETGSVRREGALEEEARLPRASCPHRPTEGAEGRLAQRPGVHSLASVASATRGGVLRYGKAMRRRRTVGVGPGASRLRRAAYTKKSVRTR